MTNQVHTLLLRLRRDERGISAMEYGVLAAAIIAAVIAATTTLSGYITDAVGRIGTSLGS